MVQEQKPVTSIIEAIKRMVASGATEVHLTPAMMRDVQLDLAVSGGGASWVSGVPAPVESKQGGAWRGTLFGVPLFEIEYRGGDTWRGERVDEGSADAVIDAIAKATRWTS